MIPILYRGNEKQFQTNGLGRLADCVSCTATEERNGIYEVTFTVPVTSTMYPLIEIGCIVCVIHDDKKDLQPFDIYAKSAELDGLVTFYARHISYRLRNIILKPFTAQSCAAALDQMATQTYNPNPFTFWTDKAVSASWANRVPNSCRAMLMGHQGSILDVYGKGEYEFDKWTVRLYTNRGNDNGMSIRYGVNLTEMDQEFSLSDSYSAVAPYWQSPEGDVVVMLPEGYIVSGEVPIKRSPWTTASGEVITTASGEPIEFNVPQIVPVPMDLSADFEEQPTEDQLRDRARQLLENSEAWLPDENITISFVDLAHTADYAEVSALQRVSLCDRINVYCGPLGITAKAQVVRVVYNVIEECYDEMELGDLSISLSEALGINDIQKDSKSTIEQIISQLDEVSYDTGWVLLPTTSNTGELWYRVVGKTVFLDGISLSVTHNTTFCTLPSAIRPTKRQTTSASFPLDKPTYVNLYENGNMAWIQLGGGTTTQLYFTMSYPI